MNFGLNRLQNHHLEPRNRLDLIMMEPSSSELEDRELAAGSAAVEFDGGGGEVEREHMFDKVVTPSDVGKLNRLVIPKQHAERFFPLDSSTNDKGLLLNFEDRNGKSWRFRYSYWNSSQSYVMTKGWSRFVKEKRLDAGDIVSFQRGVGEIGRDRLYIDWRRRPELPIHHHHSHPIGIRPSIVVPAGAAAWGSLVWRPLSATAPGYHQQQHPATAAPRDHTHLSQTNNNYNNIIHNSSSNNNINMVYDCNRVCCPYGSGMVYNLRREVGRARVGEDDEEELLEMNSNYQVQQEYCSGGGAGNSMVVQQAANNNNNYDGDYCLEKKTRTNYSDEDHHHHHHHHHHQDHEEEDIPVKKSRLRLFGVNMEMESPIIMNSCNSNSEELCDNLLLSSSSNSNPKSTTTTHQLIQLPSPSTTTTTTSP